MLPPFQVHSTTSLQAAVAFVGRAPNARQRVFCLLLENSSGLTDEEIQEALQMNANTERPRRVELQRAGLVFDSGTVRPTSTGQDAVVWKISGQPYPKVWPKEEKTLVLVGRAKAIEEIKRALPEHRRSVELQALLQELESSLEDASLDVECGEDIVDDWRF